MSTGEGYKEEELCFFRLSKCIADHSSAALRKVFKREWNYLYRHSPWLDNRISGSQLVGQESFSSHLYCRTECKHIKERLEEGNTADWDVTALVFALKYSSALDRIRCGDYWKKIDKAIYQIKEVKNVQMSHAPKASLSRHEFERNVDILIQAVKDLLSRSDPLVEMLETLRNENDFKTDGLLRRKKTPKDDQDNLLRLEENLKKLEDKMQLQPYTVKAEFRGPETSCDNGKIISRMRHRISKLKREVEPRSVDLFPSRSKPAIFRSARYIQLINKSYFLSYNFHWGELKKVLSEYDDDIDLKMFAGIQSVVSLSHQSRKKEALAMLDRLIAKLLHAKHG